MIVASEPAGRLDMWGATPSPPATPAGLPWVGGSSSDDDDDYNDGAGGQGPGAGRRGSVGSEGEDSDLNQQLWVAVEQNDVRSAQQLLGAGADVESRHAFSRFPGCTALSRAAHSDQRCAMVRLLLAHGADVNACITAGAAPLVRHRQEEKRRRRRMTMMMMMMMMMMMNVKCKKQNKPKQKKTNKKKKTKKKHGTK